MHEMRPPSHLSSALSIGCLNRNVTVLHFYIYNKSENIFRLKTRIWRGRWNAAKWWKKSRGQTWTGWPGVNHVASLNLALCLPFRWTLNARCPHLDSVLRPFSQVRCFDLGLDYLSDWRRRGNNTPINFAIEFFYYADKDLRCVNISQTRETSNRILAARKTGNKVMKFMTSLFALVMLTKLRVESPRRDPNRSN